MSVTLDGRTILITRTRSQSSSFSSLLEEKGATVIEIPTIEIVPCAGPDLDQALKDLNTYDWLFFTSVNGVEIFFERLGHLGLKPVSLPRICTIGPATKERVEAFGHTVELQPALFQAEGVIQEFTSLYDSDLTGLQILLPRARVAREILPETLRRLGATVDLIPVYDTIVPPNSAQELKRALETREIDLITFTSSSTVSNFLKIAGDAEGLSELDCGAIGPITAETAERNGLHVVVTPREFTIPAFVEAIESYFTSK